jgi:uncharacterized protein
VTELHFDLRRARRLAFACAGLLRPAWLELPSKARPRGPDAVRRCHAVIDQFGYLQLDAVSVTGARSHSIVMASRLAGLATATVEGLLTRDAPLFEYWGHEACWLPTELYPAFEFRRRDFQVHPWWGDLLNEHRKMADDILARVRGEGALRSIHLEGERGEGWWNLKLSKRVAEALWSAGELTIAARNNFQRVYDLPERVIPQDLLDSPWPLERALDALVLKALDGHGWATTSTIAATWRLRKKREVLAACLERLREKGDIVACQMRDKGLDVSGWVQTKHLDLAERLAQTRVQRNSGVLLSPFDPVLWDRGRVAQLFGFQILLEIYKPAAIREYGYYVLPILVGERFVARVDLKADRASGTLHVLAKHHESSSVSAGEAGAIDDALHRFAGAVGLEHVVADGKALA